MKINSAEFMLGAASVTQLPHGGLPEIALAGRSNVGKSSLLNKSMGRKGLARISQTPGKTQELNLYLIEKKLILVDLPGYGYAKVSKVEKNSFVRFAPLSTINYLITDRALASGLMSKYEKHHIKIVSK